MDYANEAKFRRWIDQHGYLLEQASHGALEQLLIQLSATNLAAAPGFEKQDIGLGARPRAEDEKRYQASAG